MSLTPEGLRESTKWDDCGPCIDNIPHAHSIAFTTSQVIELADELERLQSASLIKNGARLLDLVRYKRHDLHEDGLITDEAGKALILQNQKLWSRLRELFDRVEESRTIKNTYYICLGVDELERWKLEMKG